MVEDWDKSEVEWSKKAEIRQADSLALGKAPWTQGRVHFLKFLPFPPYTPSCQLCSSADNQVFTIHPDNFALSLTWKPSAFLSQKQKLLKSELFFSHRPETTELIAVWCPSLTIITFFKKVLKTYLFKSAYE